MCALCGISIQKRSFKNLYSYTQRSASRTYRNITNIAGYIYRIYIYRIMYC